MNRSFQAFAVLVVSLTGAMLTVTWTPAVPRRRDGRTASHIYCGYAVARPTPPQFVASQPLPALGAVNVDRPWRELIDRALHSQAAAKIVASFRQAASLATTARLLPDTSSSASAIDAERQRIEQEYAAAELAAAQPASLQLGPRLQNAASQLGRSIAWLRSGELVTSSRPLFSQWTQRVKEFAADTGLDRRWQEAAAQVELQKQWLVLRETFWPVAERLWLPTPVNAEPKAEPPPPLKRPSRRRMILATAEALESLSQLLHDAAARLEEASQLDVAELHTPVEKGEEKR